MDGWFRDLLVNLSATSTGALAALGCGWWFTQQGRRKNETRLLLDLVNLLYCKRAPSPANVAGDQPADWARDDQQWRTTSVLGMRDHIGEIANQLSVCRDVQPLLDDMQTRCIAWLGYVEQHPSDYVTGLVELRAQLLSLEHAIVDRQPGLVLPEPGGGDVDPPRLFV